MKYICLLVILACLILSESTYCQNYNDFPFDLQGIIVGKVFIDLNENGRQDKGEEGVEGVKIIMENGIYVKTGPNGKFSIPNVTEGFHVLELDDWSLPPGLILISKEERSKFVNLPEGGTAEVNFSVKEDL